MTNLPSLPAPHAQAGGFDRRKLIKGAAALAATAVTMKSASAASVATSLAASVARVYSQGSLTGRNALSRRIAARSLGSVRSGRARSSAASVWSSHRYR